MAVIIFDLRGEAVILLRRLKKMKAVIFKKNVFDKSCSTISKTS